MKEEFLLKCCLLLDGISKNVMGIETFGASGPAEKVMEKFNFTAEALAKRISAILDNLK